MTADPPFCHAFPLSGEGDFRDSLGGECEGERLLLSIGDRDLWLVTTDPPFCHAFSLPGEEDFHDFLGGECGGERLLLTTGDRDLCLLSLEGDDEELCLCFLSSLSPLPLLVVGDLDRDRI